MTSSVNNKAILSDFKPEYFPSELWPVILEESTVSDLVSLSRTRSSLYKILSNSSIGNPICHLWNFFVKRDFPVNHSKHLNFSVLGKDLYKKNTEIEWVKRYNMSRGIRIETSQCVGTDLGMFYNVLLNGENLFACSSFINPVNNSPCLIRRYSLGDGKFIGYNFINDLPPQLLRETKSIEKEENFDSFQEMCVYGDSCFIGGEGVLNLEKNKCIKELDVQSNRLLKEFSLNGDESQTDGVCATDKYVIASKRRFEPDDSIWYTSVAIWDRNDEPESSKAPRFVLNTGDAHNLIKMKGDFLYLLSFEENNDGFFPLDVFDINSLSYIKHHEIKFNGLIKGESEKERFFIQSFDIDCHMLILEASNAYHEFFLEVFDLRERIEKSVRLKLDYPYCLGDTCACGRRIQMHNGLLAVFPEQGDFIRLLNFNPTPEQLEAVSAPGFFGEETVEEAAQKKRKKEGPFLDE